MRARVPRPVVSLDEAVSRAEHCTYELAQAGLVVADEDRRTVAPGCGLYLVGMHVVYRGRTRRGTGSRAGGETLGQVYGTCRRPQRGSGEPCGRSLLVGRKRVYAIRRA